MRYHSKAGCEFGSDVKAKGFVPRYPKENKVCAFYCSAKPVYQGTFWRLCKKHLAICGDKLRTKAGK